MARAGGAAPGTAALVPVSCAYRRVHAPRQGQLGILGKIGLNWMPGDSLGTLPGSGPVPSTVPGPAAALTEARCVQIDSDRLGQTRIDSDIFSCCCGPTCSQSQKCSARRFSPAAASSRSPPPAPTFAPGESARTKKACCAQRGSPSQVGSYFSQKSSSLAGTGLICMTLQLRVTFTAPLA